MIRLLHHHERPERPTTYPISHVQIVVSPPTPPRRLWMVREPLVETREPFDWSATP